MSLFLIILAAGDSKRLKTRTPKPYHLVNNKTLLEYSIDAFKEFKEIKKTIVVYNKKHKKYLDKLNLKKIIKITGDKSRQKSTYKALKYLKRKNCKKILIHDSARPAPSKNLIKKVIFNLKNNNAVVPLIKVCDAAKRVHEKNIFKNINRNNLRLSQTPQGFTFKKIYKKHSENIEGNFDDDSAFFTKDKEKVFIVNGDKKNIKITDSEDLKIFKLFRSKKEFYGIGFDIHRLGKGLKLYLGGVKIPFPLGLVGHSDADPVIHSLIDSLLGACRLGNIGKLFPDKNSKYKNIRSTVLLEKVIELIKYKKFEINNVDINIIAQQPKIIYYEKKMKVLISKICRIKLNQINIKGKTTEKLGLIGKGKAIASETITSVFKYD